jgi:hypothetical protein
MHVTTIIAAALFCVTAATANAIEYHWRVKSYLDDAAKLCKEHGGTLRTPDDRTVRLIDVNDDGHDDYVIDYRWLRCEGHANVFCSSDGFCGIDFLSWRSDNEWKLFLHASVADWRVRKGSKPALVLLQRQFCQRPKDPQCTMVYTFRNGKMSGKIWDAKYFKTAK